MANPKTKSAVKINKQREVEKKKRKKRVIKLIIFLLILIIIGICTYLLKSPIFNISEIKITGNKELTKEEIEEIAKVKIGDNIFPTLNIVVKVRIKQNGYIEDVKLKKIYPNKIEIEVTERTKEFQILTDTGCYIYIDEQGYLIDYSLDKLEIPTIIGMDIQESEIGKQNRLGEKDLEKMENILQIFQETKKIEISEKITKIQIEENDEYTLFLEKDGIQIKLGDATNLKNRMYYVNAILKKEIGHTGIMYVNGNLNDGFLPYFSEN